MPAFNSPDWAQVLIPDAALAESFLRGSVIYLSLIVLFRVALKRQGGSIGLPDVMLVVLVSECVSNVLSANANSVPNGLVTASALLFWNYVLDRLAGRWPRLRRLLEPEPVQIVKDGKPVRENLDAEGITGDELSAQLRENGVDDVTQVKSAFVESEGCVSVIKKEENSPAPAPEPSPRGCGTVDGAPNEEQLIRQFLAAAEELRGVLEWHELRAAKHQTAARSVRALLAERGVRMPRK
ncbi:hypothetical protein GobsT_02200 [Gemmata obscuriglobus]|uniref:DUF421 domain-containing protein n=1 Tax=Gemmata obscuriglobus TaxID=114 RepID=A0A2Z3H304_9BACT|nr:YetF domain-containing protein [Gemmata obscuriglobus]AWM41169.1 DUF421 domain-containing protein [Gemmata obscuriglobus]QEG25494.1 hypothetical protein GobsT_02200 [Gemmata obscuriglobus]VTR98748.1 Uncharacterized protein OS=Cyanothece sp. (strain PCC 7425 / ATCC 29141) GN=Cyan7425_0947 PE=4 SV=1: DUF421 [Gemmata obscuriglobus UQM 2246]